MFDPSTFRAAVRQTARSTSSKFPSYVSAEDVEQELYLWLYANRNWIQRDMETDEPDQVESKIKSLMRKAAFDVCNREKAAAEGFDPSDVYRYTPQKIARLLPDVFDYEDWQSFGTFGSGQPTARPQANMTGDRIVELIDIKDAVLSLSQDTQDLLILQYVHHCSMEEIAEEFDITVEAAKKRAQRALKGLQKALGYKDPVEVSYPNANRRTVKSNTAWQASQDI